MAGATTRPATGARRRAQACPRGVELLQGDCIEVLRGLAEDSVDAVVTDPPYAIGWQHERWDGAAIREAAGRAGWGRLTRRDSFEVWCRLWAGECARVMKPGAYLLAFGSPRTFHRLACGLEDGGLEILDTLMWMFGHGLPKSHRFPGGRSATLKPAFEPITLARAPREGATITETIGRHGTGALHTDACRTEGRHPANLVASHEADCDGEGCAPGCAVALLDSDAGRRAGPTPLLPPSRFLYCPRVSRAEREAGCEALPARSLDHFPHAGRRAADSHTRNPHPTVKPLELMRWLVRLVCPPGGLVLDPFAGSGTTGAAAVIEGRRFLGVELEEPYMEIAAARIAHWAPSPAAGPKAGSHRRRPLGGRR